jgi:hypothetical protein
MRVTGAMRLGATLGEPHAGLARAADACPRPPAVQGTRGRGEVVGMAWEAGRALLQVRRAPPLRATTIWKGALSAPGRAQCSACHSQELHEDVEATAPRYRHEWWDHDVVAWDNITVRHVEKTCMPYINEFVRNSSEIPVIAASLCCWPAPLGLPEF